MTWMTEKADLEITIYAILWLVIVCFGFLYKVLWHAGYDRTDSLSDEAGNGNDRLPTDVPE